MSKLKTQLIAMLLENPTYAPDSGLVTNLTKALNRLSLNDIQNLKDLVNSKTDENLRELQNQIRHMEQKQQHGCTDATCPLCDGPPTPERVGTGEREDYWNGVKAGSEGLDGHPPTEMQADQELALPGKQTLVAQVTE